MKTTKAILILAGALFLLFSPVSSKADMISVDLNLPNTAMSPYTGPYVHLDYGWAGTGSSSTATFTFTSLTNTYGGLLLFTSWGTAAR